MRRGQRVVAVGLAISGWAWIIRAAVSLARWRNLGRLD